jgi:hypothetical protein
MATRLEINFVRMYLDGIISLEREKCSCASRWDTSTGIRPLLVEFCYLMY